MFNALTKFANFLWKEDVPRRQSFSSSVDGVVVRSHSWERTKSCEENSRTFTGYITNLFGNHGLIDGDVYFSYNVVVGSQRPQVGNEVSVIASRQHREGGWYADQVSILKQWTEENDSDHSDDSNESESVSNGLLKELAPGVGTITQCHLGEGLINEDIPFKIENCIKGYIPEVGDWVTVDLRENNGEVVAFDVQPLRQQQFTSEVSVVLRDHGYIKKDIFFYVKACADGYKPQCKDQVCCTAIESKQGKCNWRAISVSRLPRSPHNQIETAPHSNYLGDLLKDKEGIIISGISDFGKMSKEESKVITLWIRNNGNHPQTLLEIQLPTEEIQYHVDRLKVVKEMMASSKSASSSREVKGQLVLQPKMAAYVNISCTTKYIGSHKVLLVFKFDKFRIGRHLTVTVIDPYQNYMPQQSQPIQGSQQSKTPFTRYRESMDEGWVVPGEKITRFPKLQLPKKLGQYRVPQEIRNAVINSDELREVFPFLEETLCYENYESKFSLLLYLEEIQLDIDIRAFDLEQVCLNIVGEYLSLKVPGLAEGRPSVLVGDRVYLSTPGAEGGPVFEGIVHEVHSDEVYLKFNAEFHSKYLGEDYDVRFTFNRTPLRRFHQAVEYAPNLGRNVLFPTTVENQPPLYNPSSDQATESSYLTPTKSASRVDISSQLTLQFFNRQLNDRQMSAVKRILLGQCRPMPYILFGPPGTGKTITLVETILQILTKLPGSRILACAPSNSAADLLAERLHKSGILKLTDMVRLNAFQRNEDNIPDKIRPYCSSGNNLDIVVHYRIIISTCVNSGVLYTYGLKPGHFTHVFIDEAGQATEPECLIPVGLVAGTDGQITLSGDPEQLGPILHSPYTKSHGLELSFLERIMGQELYSRDETKFVTSGYFDPMLVTKLIYNYRSHPALLHLPSVLFYANELEVKAEKTLTHSLCGWKSLPNKTVPILFHGIRGEDLREGNCPSWFNPFETVQVVRYLQGLLADYSSYLTEEDIGIITPYRKQVEKIRMLLSHLGRDVVKVGSVEEFQGQERKAIIISAVRTNEELMNFDQRHILGFLCNPKRFNVCITRAQALLIIVGNPYVLMHDFYWLTLLKYCVENDAYVGCELPEKVTAACDS
ncbi:RNA helicase Mov10l1 isoform X1 [Octopus bimaculoides]|uniref:RNA helicase n=1 Tax=Octopus bimaculoides TaxID=37653 RepID=A0A0L8FVI3_OCTBM|nr:RNA helicase Mov10l1 isoform X1 [Octopus bimaculoides]|eukprot:XP_014786677.1 PREDICTED: putative helicase Mov10l1 isoform X1 [Octopus bimaculoides]